jgi:hypothetical protein
MPAPARRIGRQRFNPTANVVSETTNCNSRHPGRCGRSDVRSFGMGAGSGQDPGGGWGDNFVGNSEAHHIG